MEPHLGSFFLESPMLRVDELQFLTNGPYSFSIHPKEIIGFYGQSGVGKSLMLRALVDIIPHSGRVVLINQDLSNVPADKWRKQVGLVPAESVWWYETVEPHFPAKKALQGFPLEEKLENLGFSIDVLNWQVSRLSSGEKQRLSLLRTMVNFPKVLLLDEPTSNLDHKFTEVVEMLVKDYVTTQNASCIVVSHDEKQLQRIADRSFEVKKDCLIEEYLSRTSSTGSEK